MNKTARTTANLAPPEGRGLRSAGWLAGHDVSTTIARAWLRGSGVRLEPPGAPIVGICDTASDLNPCNLPHRGIGQAVADGIVAAGGIPLRFPVISISEPFVKPTTMLLRNLMAMDVEEMIRGQPVDAVVLLGGCDKTTPALVMGAVSADVPAIMLVSGPMIPGAWHGETIASGTDLRRYEEDRLAGHITDADYLEIEEAAVMAPGTCAVMGTASTMAILTETLGLALRGGSTIPATDPRRMEVARHTGSRAVELAMHGPRPAEVLDRLAFENAVTVLAALGGSTNAVIHLLAIAGRAGIPLDLDDFDRIASATPVLADIRPTGRGTILDFDRAGGLDALIIALGDRLTQGAAGVDGPSVAPRAGLPDPEGDVERMIHPVTDPVAPRWARILRGNLAPDGAIIKTSATDDAHHVHRGPALVFDDRETLMRLVADRDADLDPDVVMVLRGIGPVGGPGMPEWGWWPVPASLLRRGIRDVVRLTDGRMSGTAYGTVVLHVEPEAAVGGPIGLIRDGDIIELDVPAGTLSVDIHADELARRGPYATTPARADRGYLRLYQESVLPASAGCDFDFLRAT